MTPCEPVGLGNGGRAIVCTRGGRQPSARDQRDQAEVERFATYLQVRAIADPEEEDVGLLDKDVALHEEWDVDEAFWKMHKEGRSP